MSHLKEWRKFRNELTVEELSRRDSGDKLNIGLGVDPEDQEETSK